MAQRANDLQDKSSDGVDGREEDQHDFRIFPDDGDEEAQENDGEGRLAAGPGDVLEAVITDGAGHERAESRGEEEPGHSPTLVVQRSFKSVHEGGDDAGGGGRGKADEIL